MIEVQSNGDGCKVQLQGELTIYQAESLAEQLLPLVKDHRSMVIDLSDVSDLDTSCAQVLMVARRTCLGKDKPFSLVNHSQPVIDVFETLGLVSWFDDPVVLKPEAGGARPQDQDASSAEEARS